MIDLPMTDLTDRTLITEEDVRNASVGATVRIAEKALVTPVAADLARARHIRLDLIPQSGGRGRPTKIALGADHGGFEMKEALKTLLSELGVEYQDFGANSTDPVDYPDFAQAVALAVARKTCDL